MKIQSKLLILSISIILFSLISSADITVIEVEEGELVNLKVSASDADEDVLYYTYDLPLDEDGQWQTTYGDYGEYEVDITVSDGVADTIKSVLIKVNKANWPPVLEEIEDIVLNEGETITIVPKVEDEEDDEIKITISSPIGDDGVWETTYEDSGDYNIIVTATDGKHDPVSQEFLVVVEHVNRDPEVKKFSPKEEDVEIKEGQEKEFSLSVEEHDIEDELTYNWELDDEEVSTSETFTYAPDFESAGEHSVQGTVSDGSVLMGVKWNVEVIDVNRIPVLEEIDDIIVDEGNLVVIEFTATDPDGDDIRYSLSDPVGDDKEWQTTYDDAGTHEIELVISDGEEEVSQDFNIIVKDVDRAPEFTEIENVELSELEQVDIELEATDADGDEVEFSAENLPPGATLKDNKFKFSTDYTTVYKPKRWTTSVFKFLHIDNLIYRNKKNFKIKFIASGKEKSTEQKVKITVHNINRAPVLLDMKDVTVNEGETITLVPKATEVDNDRVKFRLSDPIGNDGKWKTGFEDAGTYPITVMASDGKTSDSKEMTVTVKDVNRAPTIKKIKDIEIDEGETATITPIAIDPDGDEIELSIEAMPMGAELANGVFTWTPNYDLIDYRNGIGSYKITFIATDGEETATQDVIITVKDSNRVPVFSETSPASSIKVSRGKTVVFQGSAEDLDGDAITYTWKFGLFDKIVTNTPGLKRTFPSVGNKKVKLIVSDGYSKITKKWKIEVVERLTPAKTAEKLIEYGGKTYALAQYKGEEIGANEKLIKRDDTVYKLTIV
ncbi:hypothetical protein GOV06_04635 [Candidatus Woesearchaeota archaeon]|nr:hypothetical protein [Candidatus Woesearchaeota archaeon]